MIQTDEGLLRTVVFVRTVFNLCNLLNLLNQFKDYYLVMWEILFALFIIPVVIGGIVKGIRFGDWSGLEMPFETVLIFALVFGGGWFLVWLLSLL